MISGAARAEAALLVIDAHEGIQENSKRHGYMMSFLGIRNITVCINKMDLVDYNQQRFEKIKTEYLEFLSEINVVPHNVLMSAREGDNMVSLSKNMPWYASRYYKHWMDFRNRPFPMNNDFVFLSKIFINLLPRGMIVVLWSGVLKRERLRLAMKWFSCRRIEIYIKSIENFNTPIATKAYAGQSTGFA